MNSAHRTLDIGTSEELLIQKILHLDSILKLPWLNTENFFLSFHILHQFYIKIIFSQNCVPKHEN